ncbi:glycoside hydrolase family protein [Nostoc sp. CALU 1950]|uniref:glycoside hydrolase family protein n=1 Tax=Nostoc sp. CALU 1950 TaxID=3104321 RepID=UPI003EBEBA70
MTHKHLLLKLNDGIFDTTPEVINEVKILQQSLKDWEILSANELIDGKFGSKTEQAVKLFQRKHSLKEDGKVGQKTWAVLLKVSPSEVEIIYRPNGGNKIPEQAVRIVTQFEGFVDHVYDDGVGVATIGIGTTRYPNGQPVRFGDQNITLETAQKYLSHDLETTVNQLAASIPHWNEMNRNQHSALISFAYNLGNDFYGNDNFKTITSTLQDKRWDDVPKNLELYSNPRDPKVHAGLLRRRKDEGELWQGKGSFAE